MRIIYLLVISLLLYCNISQKTDNFKVSNKEQEILYNNERNKK